MSDLIERLKAAGNELAGFDGSGGLYHEAADRIAELEGSLEEWVLDGKAMKERIAELEAENHTFRMAQKACETCDAPTMQRIAELEARLEAVTKLPEQWRNIHAAYNPCADDLEAALGGDDG